MHGCHMQDSFYTSCIFSYHNTKIKICKREIQKPLKSVLNRSVFGPAGSAVTKFPAWILTIRTISAILFQDGDLLPSRISWCGAMAAQLICNQWVAGSTPVTSSIKKSLDWLKSRFFSFAVTHYLTHLNRSRAFSNSASSSRRRCSMNSRRSASFFSMYSVTRSSTLP